MISRTRRFVLGACVAVFAVTGLAACNPFYAAQVAAHEEELERLGFDNIKHIDGDDYSLSYEDYTAEVDGCEIPLRWTSYDGYMLVDNSLVMLSDVTADSVRDSGYLKYCNSSKMLELPYALN